MPPWPPNLRHRRLVADRHRSSGRSAAAPARRRAAIEFSQFAGEGLGIIASVEDEQRDWPVRGQALDKLPDLRRGDRVGVATGLHALHIQRRSPAVMGKAELRQPGIRPASHDRLARRLTRRGVIVAASWTGLGVVARPDAGVHRKDGLPIIQRIAGDQLPQRRSIYVARGQCVIQTPRWQCTGAGSNIQNDGTNANAKASGGICGENPHPHFSHGRRRCGITSMARRNAVLRIAFVKTNEVERVADEVLVSRLAAGRLEALDPLQERYGSVLTSLASRQLDRPSAEEIVQDVFLTVWQHAPNFDAHRGRFRPWMFQIARRRIINELRRRRSRPQLHADPEGGLLDGLADDAPAVAEQVAGDERRSADRCAAPGPIPAATRGRGDGIPARADP